MRELAWSASEKKVARSAFDHALESALAKLLVEFKAKAAAVVTPSEMWVIEGYLRERRRHIEDLFDYRYSQLIFVFARLIREGYLDEARLNGLSEDKREMIHRSLAG